MPGFSDNLRRAREAAGLSPEDLASRVGAAPLWLAHLEALDAALPELPHLVRLAEALGCSVDDLLAGGDDDFDHPRRRHAALIAARLGRISTLLARVNAARARGEFTSFDEQQIDEAGMLAGVCRCRAWVTSPTADLEIASGLELELDQHLARIQEVHQRATARMAAARARVASAPPAHPSTGQTPAPPSTRRAAAAATAHTGAPPADVATGGPAPPAEAAGPAATRSPSPERPPSPAAATVGTPGAGSPAAHGRASAANDTAAPAAPRRPAGHRTAMWSRPARDEEEYVCEMVTNGGEVELRLLCGERVLATKTCKNLDEAFGQSSSWKRIPDPATHFANPAA